MTVRQFGVKAVRLIMANSREYQPCSKLYSICHSLRLWKVGRFALLITADSCKRLPCSQLCSRDFKKAISKIWKMAVKENLVPDVSSLKDDYKLIFDSSNAEICIKLVDNTEYNWLCQQQGGVKFVPIDKVTVVTNEKLDEWQSNAIEPPKKLLLPSNFAELINKIDDNRDDDWTCLDWNPKILRAVALGLQSKLESLRQNPGNGAFDYGGGVSDAVGSGVAGELEQEFEDENWIPPEARRRERSNPPAEHPAPGDADEAAQSPGGMIMVLVWSEALRHPGEAVIDLAKEEALLRHLPGDERDVKTCILCHSMSVWRDPLECGFLRWGDQGPMIGQLSLATADPSQLTHSFAFDYYRPRGHLCMLCLKLHVRLDDSKSTQPRQIIKHEDRRQNVVEMRAEYIATVRHSTLAM